MLKLLRGVLLPGGLILCACDAPNGPVADPGPTVIVLNAAASSLAALGATTTITATDQAGRSLEPTTLTWLAEDPLIATVDGRGTVTARTEGTTRISASLGTARGNTDIVVRQAAATLVLASVDTLSWLGKTQVVRATATDANQHPIGTPSLSWSTSDAAIASVSITGMVTARANGTATMTASADGVTASVAVHVRQRPAALTVTPAFTKLRVLGDTIRVRAEARDSGGAPLHQSGDVSWSLEQPFFPAAELGSAGLLRASKNGESIVIAKVGGLTGRAKILVNTLGAVRVRVVASGSALPSRVPILIGSQGFTLIGSGDSIFSPVTPGSKDITIASGPIAPPCTGLDSVVANTHVVAADTVSVDVPVHCFSNIFMSGYRSTAAVGDVLDASDKFGADVRPVYSEAVTTVFLDVHPTNKTILVSNGNTVSVLSLAPGSQRQVIPGIGPQDRKVQWDSDGRRIVFLREGPRTESGPHFSLMSINQDGSDLKRLGNFDKLFGDLFVSVGGYAAPAHDASETERGIAVLRNGDDRFRFVSIPNYFAGISLSPAGAKIAYFAMDSPGFLEVYVANADGSAAVKVSPQSLGMYVAAPQWSSDGRMIAYNGLDLSAERLRVAVVNSDGTNHRLAPNDSNFDFEPRFSKDNKFIMWVNGWVYVAPVDFSRRHRITTCCYVVAEWL